MANGGWYGTREEWNRIEEPLAALDADLEAFSRKHEIAITKNLKDWPERSLRWNVGDVGCLIQIYLKSEKALTLNFWICASQDRGSDRYWKRETLKDGAAAADVQAEMSELLEIGKQKLDAWSEQPEEFEFATHMQPLPLRK